MIGLYASLAAAAASLVLLLFAALWHACEPLAYAGRHAARLGRHAPQPRSASFRLTFARRRLAAGARRSLALVPKLSGGAR